MLLVPSSCLSGCVVFSCRVLVQNVVAGVGNFEDFRRRLVHQLRDETALRVHV